MGWSISRVGPGKPVPLWDKVAGTEALTNRWSNAKTCCHTIIRLRRIDQTEIAGGRWRIRLPHCRKRPTWTAVRTDAAAAHQATGPGPLAISRWEAVTTEVCDEKDSR